MTPGGFPALRHLRLKAWWREALLDAARQQTELVFWIVRTCARSSSIRKALAARTVQEHEGKLQSLCAT